MQIGNFIGLIGEERDQRFARGRYDCYHFGRDIFDIMTCVC